MKHHKITLAPNKVLYIQGFDESHLRKCDDVNIHKAAGVANQYNDGAEGTRAGGNCMFEVFGPIRSATGSEGEPATVATPRETGGLGEALIAPANDPGEELAVGAETRGSRRGREPVDGKPTPRAKWGRVTVELPEYLIYEMKERALKHRSSVRHLVMKALRTQNFRILDADMIEDARKSNGRKRS